MATTFAPSDLEPHTLYDDLILLPHDEPFARRNGRSANCYALLGEAQSVLVDGGFADLLPAARDLADRGYPPTAILLTHRHVAAQGDAFGTFVRQFRTTLLLHPVEAQHPQARQTGHRFEDPMTPDILQHFGLGDAEVLFFPGHTEGHIMVYRRSHGGVLLTGDCAMGPRFDRAQDADEGAVLVRPPLQLMVDDEQLRRNWEAFDRPVATVGPYHGGLFVDQADTMAEVMVPLKQERATHSL